MDLVIRSKRLTTCRDQCLAPHKMRLWSGLGQQAEEHVLSTASDQLKQHLFHSNIVPIQNTHPYDPGPEKDTSDVDDTKAMEGRVVQETSTTTNKQGFSSTGQVFEPGSQASSEKTSYDISYLLVRMASINKDSWKKYAVGSIAAVGKFYSSLTYCILLFLFKNYSESFTSRHS